MIHATLENMRHLRLKGMVQELEAQLNTPDALTLSFEERLGLLIDAEIAEKDSRQLRSRLKKARIGQNACVEDIDWTLPRKLDRDQFRSLSNLQWIRFHRNLCIVGPTGIGKSFLSSAMAQKACRDGYTVHYDRSPVLFKRLAEAKVTGEYPRFLSEIAKKDLLVIDDFGLKKLNEEARLDLLEIMESRYENRSTLVTSQFPTDHWHDTIGDPTIADAIMDRLIHNAHVLTLNGDSIRKVKGKKKLEAKGE